MPGMSNPGRRPGTPAEYREAILTRTKERREAAGLSLAGIAQRLTEACHRPISADTYRKWETESLIPHDVILPFCDITRTHPFELLASVPFQKTGHAVLRKRQSAA